MRSGAIGPDAARLFDGALTALAAGSVEYFGEPGARCHPIAHIRRPWSDVLKFRVELRDSSFDAFLKIRKLRQNVAPGVDTSRDDRLTTEFANTLRVFQAFANDRRFSTVRPIACFPEHRAIVTAGAAGRTLSELIERRARWMPDSAALDELTSLMSASAEWVLAFQNIGPVAVEPFSVAELTEYVDIRLHKLVNSSRARFADADRRAVLAYMTALGAEVPREHLVKVAVHGDFAPGNVLADGGRVAALDFFRSTQGSKYQDLARMFTQLDLLKAKPQYRPAVIDRLQLAMLRRYDPALRPDDPLFELLVLMHTINHFAGLAVRPAPMLSRIYNRYLRHRHRRWLQARLAPAIPC
jgi:hypothetical protein